MNLLRKPAISPMDVATLSQAKAHQTSHRSALMWGGVVTLPYLFCYAGVLKALVGQWWNNDMYSYGFLIPGISCYLAWIQRERLKAMRPVPHYWGGGALLLSGLSLFLAGTAGGVLLVEELSLVVTLAGGILFLLGWTFLKVLLLPVAYLLFMIPVWDVVAGPFYAPLQIFSAKIGTFFLQAVGVPIYLDGVYLYLPTVTLEVAKVCSGVNYLIAVIAIGIPMAVLFLHTWTRRVLLVIIAVVIAILANGLRVGLIGWLAYYHLGGDIHGPYHVLQGLSVSFIGYGAIGGAVWLLSRGQPISTRRHDSGASRILEHTAQTATGGTVRLLSGVLAVLFLATGVYGYAFQTLPIKLKNDLNRFPQDIARWQGENVSGDRVTYQNFKVDHSLLRRYRTSGKEIEAYIGYLEYQKQGRELINYETRSLHQDASEIVLDVPPRGPIRVNQVLGYDGGQRMLTLFWYDINGRIVADQYKAKMYETWDALIRRKSNGAVIVLRSAYNTPDDLQEALSDSRQFLGEFLPMLQQYLPNG